MPVYDYECESCKEIVEVDRGMNEEVTVKCPKCGKKMKYKFSLGHGDFFMNSGGTRKGHKGTRGT